VSDLKINHLLDASGIYCPEPVMMLHSKIDEMAVGEVLEVLATDPSTKRDIPKFCNFLGHELIEQGERETLFFYIIKKG
jgi:tRNA 2-thiouridine synthesizing protein A